MRKENKYFGSIIYTTRTHSQISQLIYELKKACYEPKIAILSSREFSCINKELKNALDPSVLDIKCSKEHRNCSFYKNAEFFSNIDTGPADIEDIIKKGEANHFCLFYSKRLEVKKGKCDLIFMPYNYIFMKEIRETMDIKLYNHIVIIDEAHNVTNNCEEAMSVEVNTKDFEEMITDLKEIKREINKNSGRYSKVSEEEEDKEEEEFVQEEENNLNDNASKYKIYSLRADYLVKEIDAIKNIMQNLKHKYEVIKDKNLYNKKNYIEIEPIEFLSIFIKPKEDIKALIQSLQNTIPNLFNLFFNNIK